MEDAAEALKMAAAVLTFIGALALAMMMIGKARATSDSILYLRDKANYQHLIYSDAERNRLRQSVNEDTGNRIVGKDTIISTLYRYYKEGFKIEFIDTDGHPLWLYELPKTIRFPYDIHDPEREGYMLWLHKYAGIAVDSPFVRNQAVPVILHINYFDLADETSQSKINGEWTKGSNSGILDSRYEMIRKNIAYFVTRQNPGLTIVNGRPKDLAPFTTYLRDLPETFEEMLSEYEERDPITEKINTKRIITYKQIIP